MPSCPPLNFIPKHIIKSLIFFIRCGCAEGLEAGRHCLKKWGFRRCEDICWIKTNREQPGKKLSAVHQEPNSVLVHTKVRIKNA